MADYNPWVTVGWVNIDEYLYKVRVNGYQILHQDEQILVVRIPPDAGRIVHWHILEWSNSDPVHRMMWLSQTIRRARMREVLVHRLGAEKGNSIIDDASKMEASG